jgi:Grx4 family monothiol glutaredoxin
MSTLNEITSEVDFNTHVSSLPPSALLVLYFHTPWAAPCTQMRTVLSTLASTYPVTNPPSVSFVSANAEELLDISEQYDVTAVPFLVLIRDGTVLESISGYDAAKVCDAVEKYVGTPAKAAAGGITAEKQSIPPPLPTDPRKAPVSAAAAAVDTSGVNGVSVSSHQTSPSQDELFARIAELVKAAPVMLFMKGTPSEPQCGFSRKLVGLLRENGVKYGFFNILADEDVRQGLKEFADWPTYPQLWVKGELIGGLDIVSCPLCIFHGHTCWPYQEPIFSTALDTNPDCVCKQIGQGRTQSGSRLPSRIRYTSGPHYFSGLKISKHTTSLVKGMDYNKNDKLSRTQCRRIWIALSQPCSCPFFFFFKPVTVSHK